MQTRRRIPLGAREGGAPTQQVAQDGFSASVRGAQTAQTPHSTSVYSGAAAQAPMQGIGFVGRRVLEITDNADGTATVVRCIDRQAEDIDIQFEAGVRTVSAIAPKAFEGCTALRRVILPGTLKMIGEMAAVLHGQIDGILLTGGYMRFPDVIDMIREMCGWIAPVTVYPGEMEQEALALAVYEALNGEREIRRYAGKPVWEGFDGLDL